MNSDRDLTILLTLKDRVDYTVRWLAYAQQIRLPFKVLIADGGADEEVAAMLSDRARFPDVDIEYLRYPEDTNYPRYFAKIEDALCRVSTPFVAMADNDDFLVTETLRRAVQFLVANPAYAACGGQGALFWVVPGAARDDAEFLYGPRVDMKCTSLVRSNEAESASERLRAMPISTADPLYYDVKRIEDARHQFKIVRRLDLTDLFLVEYLVHYLTVIAGKTMRFDGLFLARQHNAPGSSGVEHQRRYGDWLGRMLVDSWSGDFAKFASAAAEALAAADGMDLADARDKVVEAYRSQVAPALLSDLLEERTVTLPMLAVLPAVRRLVNLPEGSLLRRSLRRIYRRVSWISLDAVLGTEIFAKTTKVAERDFRPIREFLGKST